MSAGRRKWREEKGGGGKKAKRGREHYSWIKKEQGKERGVHVSQIQPSDSDSDRQIKIRRGEE